MNNPDPSKFSVVNGQIDKDTLFPQPVNYSSIPTLQATNTRL